MGKPFSDLERRAIALVAVQPNYTTWPDEELRKFWAWKIYADRASHNLPAASERPTGRKKTKVYLTPFGQNIPTTVVFGCTISERSNTARTTQSLTDAALGYEPIAAKMDLTTKRFKPARVYYRTGDAADSIGRVSRITGRTYKTYYSGSDQGYSAPFGKVGTDTEGARQTALKTAIGTDIKLITFTSERI